MGSMTLRSALARLRSSKDWKMNPISSLRTRARRPIPSRWVRLPLSTYSPVGRFVEAPEDVHEGGLARARGAHDGDELVGADVEVHAVERADLLVAHLVVLGERADPDDGLVRVAGSVWTRRVAHGVSVPASSFSSSPASPSSASSVSSFSFSSCSYRLRRRIHRRPSRRIRRRPRPRPPRRPRRPRRSSPIRPSRRSCP